MRVVFMGSAEAFIKRNYAEAIGPAEVAEAVDISTRALFAGFKAYLNTTPMRYLKELRLNLVHNALRKVEPHQTSVTTIALDHGFSHLGHFCAAYKEKFGELPRDTLRLSGKGPIVN